jgi:hypothetical protein
MSGGRLHIYDVIAQNRSLRTGEDGWPKHGVHTLFLDLSVDTDCYLTGRQKLNEVRRGLRK